MKKILVSAYAASPIRGSECAVGWEITKRLGEYFDVTVLVCNETPSGMNFFNEIQDYLLTNEIIKKNVKYIPIDMPQKSKKYTRLHDNGFWPAYYWGYKSWQRAAFKKAKQLHSEKPFDIAYQLNMIGFREPGYLWKLDIPFVWGPINGFHSIPFAFIREFNRKERVFHTLRHLTNETQILLASRAKKAAKKASIVWCVDNTALNIMTKWAKTAQLMQETGLTTVYKHKKIERSYNGKRTLNLVCSGNLTTRKAYSIAIESLLKLKDKNFHLTILGDGPAKNKLFKLAKPISSRITWVGRVPRSKAIEIMNKSDLLLHPSLSEGTTNVILEAISMGMPVICHDICGMGIVVNEKNGFKIPYKNMNNSVLSLSKILESILENPKILNNKFNTIYDNIESLTWDNKVCHIAKTILKIVE